MPGMMPPMMPGMMMPPRIPAAAVQPTGPVTLFTMFLECSASHFLKYTAVCEMPNETFAQPWNTTVGYKFITFHKKYFFMLKQNSQKT